MTAPITLERISITGFRAYSVQQDFTLVKGKVVRSLAVFAPNAKGKSSFVDALEFYFSPSGTLARLGERKSGTHAGREPLIHADAPKDGSGSSVLVGFQGGPKAFAEQRTVGRDGGQLPKTVEQLRGIQRVDFIIRGHDLRAFVEQRTPEERYAEVSGWFGFAPLVAVQRNLRSVRRHLNKKLKEETASAERQVDLLEITDQALERWDDERVLHWVNESMLKVLDPSLVLDSLSAASSVYGQIKARKIEEEQRAGLQILVQASDAIRSLLSLATPAANEHIAGAIRSFEEAVASLAAAQKASDVERSRAEKAVFKDVWEAATKLFDDPLSAPEGCPVCKTPISSSAVGSQAALSVHLHAELDGLSEYRRAEAALSSARATCAAKISALRSQLSTVINALKLARFEPEAASTSAYLTLCNGWKPGVPAPDSATIDATLQAALERLSKTEGDIRRKQGTHTYAAALLSVDKLLTLKARLDLLNRSRVELQKLADALSTLASSVDAQIRSHIQSVVDSLKDETNRLCQSIQGHQGAVPEMRMELADEADQNQQRLTLTFDFDASRKAVTPHAYLSDAQIHTLALSLRLAAIKTLNGGFPVIVLDDVVTSYDADHRLAIASTLATHFDGFQIILVTHDERFFRYLQDHLSAGRWDFKQITSLDRSTGPRFMDHRVTDDMIQAKWNKGEKCANEIRQAEEEWLLARCLDFGVDIRIRGLQRPYSYERAELAGALQAFLKKSRVTIPAVEGVNNPFLQSLQKGDVENFGSHFQLSPDGFGSIGDEKVRWREFQEFCAFFACADCGSNRFKRPTGMEHAVCSNEKCEAKLTLKPPVKATA